MIRELDSVALTREDDDVRPLERADTFHVRTTAGR